MSIPNSYRVVQRCVHPGERYLHDGEVHTWALNVPSSIEYPVLEPIPHKPTLGDAIPNQQTSDWTARMQAKPKKQLLVLVYEICEHPEDIKTQITPALAEALVTPAYAKGVIAAGYVARIIDAPE